MEETWGVCVLGESLTLLQVSPLLPCPPVGLCISPTRRLDGVLSCACPLAALLGAQGPCHSAEGAAEWLATRLRVGGDFKC